MPENRVGRWQSEAEAPPRDLGLFKASLETAEKGELSGKVRPLYPLAFVQGVPGSGLRSLSQ